MDWHDWKAWATIGGGMLLSAMLSQAKTFWQKLVGVASGAFCAVLFTEPIIHWLNLEFTVWQYAVAGLLALSGDRIVRRLFRQIEDGDMPLGK